MLTRPGEPEVSVSPIAVSAPKRIPCDGVFATAIISPTRILAVFYWARYMHYGKPLVLCDYDVDPLDASSWKTIENRLKYFLVERKSRLNRPTGVFVETELIASQAMASGLAAQSIPPWLVVADAWNQIMQSAATILAKGDVGYTLTAREKMETRPFLNEAGVVVGPRPEDPTIAAFLFGVILALDPAAARDPHPKPPARASRN